jgi:hypothetical protein
MRSFKPVAISKEAFIFCRYSIAVLIWISLILRLKWLLIVVLIFFLLSVWLKVKRSPFIWLYEHTMGRLRPLKEEWLNERSMRFAHLMGAILSFICLVLLYGVNDRAGWIAVFIFALLKSVSAAGFCPAGKLYECATNDSCCAFIKKHG